MTAEDYVQQLEMQTVWDHYTCRERIHFELRRLFDEGEVDKYVELALGIENNDGNYSASLHGLGHKILDSSSRDSVFACATAIDGCEHAEQLPKEIRHQGLRWLAISVGSEMATMLQPQTRWIANVRTIWWHLLLKHKGRLRDVNFELKAYRNADPGSEMHYQLWEYIYLALEESMLKLNDIATKTAKSQGVPSGRFPFLWADATAAHLFGKFSKH